MRGFKFRLQILLDVKKTEKKKLDAQYSKALSLIQEIEQRLEKNISILNSINLKQKQSVKNGMNASDLVRINNYKSYINDCIKKENCSLVEAKNDLKEVQNKLIKKMREIDVLHKLKEKKYEEYKQELKTQSDKQIDEIVSYRYSIKGE